MAMKIIAVRIGDRYGPEYEKYLERKLPEYEFVWVRKPIKEGVSESEANEIKTQLEEAGAEVELK